MNRDSESGKRNEEARSEFERYEAKYIVDRSLVQPMRDFLSLFCGPDPNAEGMPPEYIITTLQLDTPTLALHYAKELEALTRFKLRVRTYGTGRESPVFLEIKRKIRGVVLKSRVRLSPEDWGRHLFTGPVDDTLFRTRHEHVNFLEFRRLVHVLGAQPVMLIRYTRESYISRIDAYARVTFDRRLCYCPTRSWEFPPDNVNWRPMDSSVALNRRFSGLILEIKTYRDAPLWMVDMTERFNLVRVGFCKYSTAMRLDSLFEGGMYSDQSENCTLAAIGR